MVLNNNIINVFNNYIIATDAIIKCLFYLISNKTLLIIQYKTIKFKSIYIKLWEISLPN